MGRVYTDADKLIEAADLSRNGHHTQAAHIYHDMGNEVRNPKEKKQLWELAKDSRKKGR